MSKKYLALAVACAIGAVGLVAQAQAPSAPPAGGMSANDIVGARHAGFVMSNFIFNSTRRAMGDAATEAKSQVSAANGLATWARALPTMFPAGTGPGAVTVKTRAKAEIWSDRAGFDKDAADYQAATAKLLDLAKANDMAGYKAQIVEVDKTCDACHAAYRAKETK
jgi:cytochrome c556